MKSVLGSLIFCGVIGCCIMSFYPFEGSEKLKSRKEKLLQHEEEIDQLIKKMTLEEKVGMIHANSSFTSAGVERLGIPELVMSDGPHGVRKEHGKDWAPDNLPIDSGTYLPTGITLAATWNASLAYDYGKVLGSEAKFRRKDIILGPGVNIIRSPLNGRNFEYFSEDPYLVSKLAPPYIQGVQEQGVSACIKHFLANNQETDRGSINVLMSDRALREIYLPGFEASVTEGQVYSVMGAYNQFRGEYCTHSDYLVNGVLKKELGFNGIMLSDWSAVHNTMDALLYGTDLEMGTDLGANLAQVPREHLYDSFYLGRPVIKLVRNGKVSESLIDEKVRRILRVMYQTNLAKEKQDGAHNTKAHQQLALKVAEEGIVLLKNDGVLPLDKSRVRSIAVIGANATRKNAGAGGSSQVTAKYEITPLDGIKKLVSKSVKINFAQGYEITKASIDNKTLIQEAVTAAKNSELTILVGGWTHGYSDSWNDNAYDAEGIDKQNIDLPFGQEELFREVLKANPNTIIVLIGGGAVDMRNWANKVKAIVFAGYPGMEGGSAIAKILFGEVNPSGKLPFTFPQKLDDVPAHKLGEFPGNGKTVSYNDDIFVGYRYFDTYKVEPAFPFGHGLSFTSFTMKNLDVKKSKEEVTITVQVKNTGKVAGAEVVQVYVKDHESTLPRPDKELKAFEKVFLAPNETKQIKLTLSKKAFEYYDPAKKSWVLEPGKFSVLIGNSSRNIMTETNIEW
jgi:beta-glucosidase